MLVDLCNVNATMWRIGALQPGLPKPTAIPKDWPLVVFGLEDCFCTIHVQPDNNGSPFSVALLSHKEPQLQYPGLYYLQVCQTPLLHFNTM